MGSRRRRAEEQALALASWIRRWTGAVSERARAADRSAVRCRPGRRDRGGDDDAAAGNARAGTRRAARTNGRRPELNGTRPAETLEPTGAGVDGADRNGEAGVVRVGIQTAGSRGAVD